MELNEVLLKRRSIRKFTDEAVSEEDIILLPITTAAEQPSTAADFPINPADSDE